MAIILIINMRVIIAVSGFLNLLRVAQYHLVVILTLGADLSGDMYNKIMPVHLILNLHWGTVVKILFYSSFITLTIRISWNSMRIISCLCGILEMQK